MSSFPHFLECVTLNALRLADVISAEGVLDPCGPTTTKLVPAQSATGFGFVHE